MGTRRRGGEAGRKDAMGEEIGVEVVIADTRDTRLQAS